MEEKISGHQRKPAERLYSKSIIYSKVRVTMADKENIKYIVSESLTV